jgi:CRISPR/Cas system-associated endoribonuclease Cas2
VIEQVLETLDCLIQSPKPCIRKVQYYPNANATTTLIHIRDLHFDDAYDEIGKKPMYDFISDVQRNNQQILAHMRQYTNRLFIEGFEGELTYTDAQHILNQHLKQIHQKATDTHITIPADKRTNAEYLIGAQFWEKIDNPFIHIIGVSCISHNSELGLDKRKMFALERISQEVHSHTPPQELALLMYGCLHTFGGIESCGPQYKQSNRHQQDTVAYWNTKYPSKQLSLLEITPYSLPEFTYTRRE